MRIETSARLHLSLIDLNGSMGRIDGGIGLTLEDPSLIIEAVPSDKTTINYEVSLEKADECSQKILYANKVIQEYLEIEEDYKFNIKSIYPSHQGLGLGTQLLLSTAKLISSMNNIDLDAVELAKITHRGGTSGIGVHSFNNGGLIIDGGHKKSKTEGFLPSRASKMLPPPIIARYDFPKNWDILLVTPTKINTVHGNEEVDIFKQNTPIDIRDVEKISYLTLMKLMPSIVEEDLNSFSEAINQIQQLGFKKVERKLQQDTTGNTIHTLEEFGIPCVGMSSFGPTCFGITDSITKNIIKDLEDQNLHVIKTRGKNHGAIIKK